MTEIELNGVFPQGDAVCAGRPLPIDGGDSSNDELSGAVCFDIIHSVSHQKKKKERKGKHHEPRQPSSHAHDLVQWPQASPPQSA
jgi:hypothetical protein